MYGSICLTDISNAYKAGHPGITKSEKNGKIYVNLTVWVNDTPDQYGNDAGVQISQPKDHTEKAVYIGNLKHAGGQQAQAQQTPIEDVIDDQLPF